MDDAPKPTLDEVRARARELLREGHALALECAAGELRSGRVGRSTVEAVREALAYLEAEAPNWIHAKGVP